MNQSDNPQQTSPSERPPRPRIPRPMREPDGKRPTGFNWKRGSRTGLFWVALILLAILAMQALSATRISYTEINYSEFLQQVDANNVTSAVFIERWVQGELVTPLQNRSGKKPSQIKHFRVLMPLDDADLLKRLEGHNVEVSAEEQGFNWTQILFTIGPWVLLMVFFWLFMFRQMQAGGTKGIFSFGKSRAKLVAEDRPKITFDDVAGAEEAKSELQEIIEFLKDPGKFQRLGGKIPKGALLLGAPGTGKTLLARAVAGEAGVPFFSMSGSDFVEMFVGVGASRVRDLFDQGKRHAPCIIFIDEIDAVGRHRGAGLGGGHDEREQTLNQLLVEMDGFESNEGVILLAATNRPDVLDPALLRPGRFDRQIVVDNPDVKGREGIFRVHTRKVVLDPEVDLTVLARGTPGLSGADIANLVNEAALLAARRNHDKVKILDFEDARDKVMMGIERRSLVIPEEEKRSTACHEAGHALCGKLLPDTDPVHKVTIIPRGMALGVTSFLPIDERHSHSKRYLESRLVFMMGGRVAEKMVFDHYTTGAGNDLERATILARKMVCEWGMSEKLGPLTFGKKEEEIFLGREFSRHRDYSEQTAQLIDAEISRIINEAERKAKELLQANEDKLHMIADALLEYEILDGGEIDKVIRGEKIDRPSVRKNSHPVDNPAESKPEENKVTPPVDTKANVTG